MPAIDAYLTANAQRFEDDLCELLRIPSVSTDPACRADTARAGAWVAERFRAIGLSAEVFPTAGHPIVYAESPPVAGVPKVLVYGHYDVQPVEPLELWHSPPFEPTRREGNLVARGATDDKGQFLTHVFAAEAWLKTAGRLPVQLKFLIEGEEEIGSENLVPFMEAHREKLACDCIVISDGGQFAPVARPSPTDCAASPISTCCWRGPTATCTRAVSAAR